MLSFRLSFFLVNACGLLLLDCQASAFTIHRYHQHSHGFRTFPSRSHEDGSSIGNSRRRRRTGLGSRGISTATSLRAGGQDDTNGGTGDAFSDLTSSLAKLDNQWKIQQAGRGKSRWSKLYLPKDPTAEPEEVDASDVTEEEVEKQQRQPQNQVFDLQNDSDYVWVLDPPESISVPSCIIVFTGGAGLGQFPHVAYNELLTRISNRLNALCIAVPYNVGLDHFQLAKQTGERIRRALVYLEDDPSRPYSLPRVYSLSHSLGCKLQCIYTAATGQDYDGMGFMAFNNFGFSKTIKMARTFAEELRQSTTRSRTGNMDDSFSAGTNSKDLIGGLFDLAEMAVGAIGVDFSPNSQDTERLIQLRYDDLLQGKTRVFVFDEDNLDSSKEFVDACSGGTGPSMCGIPGGHLSPVYFRWNVDDLAGFDENNIPPDAREMAKEAMGGLQSASFGDEAALNATVDAVCDWILGKPPQRQPVWARSNDKYEGEVPKITGTTTSSSSADD